MPHGRAHASGVREVTLRSRLPWSWGMVADFGGGPAAPRVPSRSAFCAAASSHLQSRRDDLTSEIRPVQRRDVIVATSGEWRSIDLRGATRSGGFLMVAMIAPGGLPRETRRRGAGRLSDQTGLTSSQVLSMYMIWFLSAEVDSLKVVLA